MIGALLRWVVPWRLTVLMSTLFVVPQLALMQTLGKDGLFVLPAVAIGAILMAVVAGRPWERSTPFEAALPISGRHLFVTRTVVRLMQLWIPGAIFLAIALRTTDPTFVSKVIGIIGLGTLGVIVPQCIRGRDSQLSVGMAVLPSVAVAALGITLWFFLPPAVALFLLALAIAVAGMQAWAMVPQSYQIVALAPDRPAVTARRTSGADRASAPPRFPAWPLVRSAFTWWWAPMLLMGIGSGVTAGQSTSLTALYFVPSAAMLFRSRSRWLTAFPVSSRTMTAVALLATVVPMVAGVGVGLGYRHVTMLERTEISLSDGPHRSHQPFYGTKTSETCVTLDLWRIAPGGKAPVIQSPTGETIVPPTFSILGLAVYNPYYVGPASSDAFLEWQFERATTAVYGYPISRQAAQKGVQLQSVPLAEHPRMLVLCGAAFVVLLLYVLYVLELTSWHRLRRPSAGAMRLLLPTLVGAPVFVLYVIDYYYQMTLRTAIALPLAQLLLGRLATFLPQNIGLVAAVGAIPVLAMFGILENQARRTEFSTPLRPAPR